jgi:predicted nucleotide-binding protein
MDRNEKLALLQQQIDDANEGSPAEFSVWRQKTEVVLRNVVGDANPLYESFRKIHYSPIVWSPDTPRSRFGEAQAAGVRQAIAILNAAKLEVEISGGTPEPVDRSMTTGHKIFIVHGTNDARKHEVARFLRALTGYEPTILHEQANGGRTIIEKFEDHAADTAYAVVIASGDDIGRERSKDSDQPRPRQNVVFELGFFFGSLGRNKVALLYEEGVERPSDTDGIVRISLDEAGGWKAILARELQEAGVGVEWSALGRM